MKQFLHKIYDASGVYIATLNRQDVVSVPTFQWSINAGLGEMVIRLAISIKDFVNNYELTIIKHGYQIKTYIQDDDANDIGVLIHSGSIITYEENVDDYGSEYINIHVVGNVKTLADQVAKSGTATTLVYNSQDPSNIIKDLLSKRDGLVEYTNSSIQLTGTSVSYTFDFIDYLGAIDKCLELTPSLWYYYIDAENIFNLKRPDDDSIDFSLYIGKEVSEMSGGKSDEELYNTVYFLGGGSPALYKKYVNSGSVTEYGAREYRMTDGRVTDAATALIMATKFLDEHDIPQSIAEVTVIDNSVDRDKGFDIELFRPGQIIQILHPHIASEDTRWDFTWDVDSWDYDFRSTLALPLQILGIQYNFDSVRLTLALKYQDVTKRIEDINRNVEILQTDSIPSSPS